MGGRLNFDGGTRPPYNLSIDYNFISFLKLPWPGDSEETFWSSSQAATCVPQYIVTN